MEKSIETIWNDGFLKDDALIAPKINDLYNLKSQFIIDKFKKMFKINLAVIAIAATITVIASFFLGVPVAGGILFLLLVYVVIIGYRELNLLKNINIGENSYQYLKAFDNWLKDVISRYNKIYRIIYPLFIMFFSYGLWFSKPMENVRLEVYNDQDIYHILGMPLYWILPVLFVSVLFSVFSEKIFRIDMSAIYGNVMNKLQELIKDMEELRS